ncbi:MAG: hypothetical protein AAF926_00760, partial [Pseudomonadota bacterium]
MDFTSLADEKKVETVPVASTNPLRQGDVLSFSWRPEVHPDHMHGIIVNADCALRHRQTAGYISYVPIYSIAEHFKNFYLSEQYLPRETHQIRQQLEKSFDLNAFQIDDLLLEPPARWVSLLTDSGRAKKKRDAIVERLHKLVILAEDKGT